MSEDIPDLKRLLVALTIEVSKHHPDVVTQQHADRIQNATNVLLVVTRILTSLSRKVGVTDAQIKNAIAYGKYVQPPVDMFATADNQPAKVDGNWTDWEIIQQVDDCLANLEHRSNLPDWFMLDLWPSVLRRCAQNKKMTDRERAIALYVTSIARGER